MSSSRGPSLQGTPRATPAAGLIPPYTVIACSVVFFWSISVRALVYTIMPTIAADLQLSSSIAGLVISILLLGYCISSLAAGWIPLGRKYRILAGVVLSLLGTLLFATANGLPMLLVAGLIVGLGVGVYLPLGLSILVEVGGTARRAYYVAVHEVAATLASFSGSAFVAVILLWTDWHGSIAVWLGVGVLALLAFALVRDEGRDARAQGADEAVFLDGRLLSCILANGVASILVTGLISVLPLIMVRAWGLDQAQAASVVGGTRLAGLVGVVIAGSIADRWGYRRVLLVLEVLSLVGGVAMATGGYDLLFQVGIVMLAAGASGSITLIPVAISDAYPTAQRERAMAVTSSVGGFLGMVLAPAIFGVLLDTGFGTGPIVVTCIATVVMIVATTRISAYPSAARRVGDAATG